MTYSFINATMIAPQYSMECPILQILNKGDVVSKVFPMGFRIQIFFIAYPLIGIPGFLFID